MSLIRKANELNVNVRIKMLIYGEPGIGKSTIALSAPEPLLFDFDGGINRVEYGLIKDTVQIEKYEDLLEVLNKEDLTPYKTLVIDTGGKMMDSMSLFIGKTNPKLVRANGNLTLQGYGQRKVEFRALLRLIASKQKDVIFVCHRGTVKDGDDIRYIPLFGGSSYDDLATELDLIGYMEANGRKRTITFDPTSHADGKNTCNMPAIMEIPTIIDEQGNIIGKNDFIETQVIKRYRDRLIERSTEGESYKKLIEQIKDDIAAIANPDDATFYIEKQKEYKHIGNSKMVMYDLFKNKIKELGFTFNKETKKYEKKTEADKAESK